MLRVYPRVGGGTNPSLVVCAASVRVYPRVGGGTLNPSARRKLTATRVYPRVGGGTRDQPGLHG